MRRNQEGLQASRAHLTADEIRTWAEDETRRRSDEERDPLGLDLGPLEQYDDKYTSPETLGQLRPDADPEATGPHSQTVRGIICGGCSGWVKTPTSEEVYEAMRAEHRTPAQQTAVGVLTGEATFDELMNAHLEGAFTWRQLARAFKEAGMPGERTGFLKRLTQPQGGE